MASSLVTSFLGALQASLAVLLTLSYGVIATQFGLLSEASAKDISKTCVRLFLPALLIHNVGSQLDSETGMRYIPVLRKSAAMLLQSPPQLLTESQSGLSPTMSSQWPWA